MEGYEKWRAYRMLVGKRAEAIRGLQLQAAIREEAGQRVSLPALRDASTLVQRPWPQCDYCGNRLKEDWLKCKWCGGPRG